MQCNAMPYYSLLIHFSLFLAVLAVYTYPSHLLNVLLEGVMASEDVMELEEVMESEKLGI